MPLLDHFQPPLAPRRHWESFHATWATEIAGLLNESLLPEDYFAEEHVHAGARIEIDVATFAEEPSEASPKGGVATLPVRVWTPPAPTLVIPAAFPDQFEVLVYSNVGGAQLVAAIELVSPANKDRPEHRRAFALKCAGYLAQGVSLVVVDIVTNRKASLHQELLSALGQSSDPAPADPLYATAYRPVARDSQEQIEIWSESLALGQTLPTLPLWLDAETSLPLDLERTYATACERKRL